MAGIDSRFIYAPSLEMLFNDKETATPLAAGIVTFYSDVNRTVKKSVYQISGTPPNYTFVELPNPIILNADGSFSDNQGNNVIPYYYPFTGTPTENTGIQELYYIKVTNADLVEQFTREGWPTIAGNGNNGNDTNLLNYIPNGQILLRNDVPFVSGNTVGQVVGTDFIIAPGGFEFQRASDTSTDLITYQRIGSYTDNPNGSPRYWLEVNCQVPAFMSYKRIIVKFNDVNKFCSNLLNATYTFSFTAQSNTLLSFPITASFVKNFGTGGSSDVIINIPLSHSFVTATSTAIFGSFSPGNNDGQTIGANNDDYCYLSINLPTNSTFDLLVTDFLLTPGTVQNPRFPVTTDAKFKYQSVTGGLPVPNPDGSDLYLPIVYTQYGSTFDDSEIGQVKILSYFSDTPPTSYLECDGDKYDIYAYSSDGIPYARLGNKLIDTNLNVRPWGNGVDFFGSFTYSTSPAVLYIYNNDFGLVTDTVDVNTGMTIATYQAGHATAVATAYSISTTNLIVINAEFGAVTNPTVGTAPVLVNTQIPGAVDVRQIISVEFSSLPAAGDYFTFSTTDGNFYVWFKVDGSGVDPAPGGTGILVNLLSTDVFQFIVWKTVLAINGYQVSTVTVNQTPANLQGKYFKSYGTGGGWYIWFTVDGVGTDPVPGGGLVTLPVDLSASDTAEQIMGKIVDAINLRYYQTPDYRGYFLRGLDTSGNTIDIGPRYGKSLSITNNIGSYEYADNQSHDHFSTSKGTSLIKTLSDIAQGGTGASIPSGDPIPFQGTEGRPINAAVRYIIKY